MDNCPLSGQPCPHKKTTHITDLNPDGSTKELHLCHLCADKYVSETTQASKPKSKPASAIASLVGSLFNLLVSPTITEKKVQVYPKVEQKPPCPGCGITLDEIARKGYLGCPKCYQHYYTELKIVAVHAHGAVKHIGKTPTKKEEIPQEIPQKTTQEQTEAIQDQIKNLKLKMTRAIKIENYEIAGVLKKKIEELQKVIDSEKPTPPSSSDQ